MSTALPRPQFEISDGALRGVSLVALVVTAYHQSFLHLVRNLSLDTPLAYLGLVPVMALGLAGVVARRVDKGPPIHDRQLDFIIGAPLLVAASLANYVLPTKYSTMYWIWRIDMLTLPIFVAGASVLLFGTRSTWKARVPIAFLFLAWPYPYTLALFRWLDAFTTVTIGALTRAVSLVHWATHDASGDGSRFAIGEGARRFTVSVASQCSGANGLLGFLLVGAALMVLVKGPRLGKVIWLTVGAAVTWLLNITRIMFVFFVGKTWGQGVAIDGFHPFIGLIMFNAGILVLVLVMRRFRLTFPAAAPRNRARVGAILPRLRFALPLALAAVFIVGSLNARLVRYGLVASDLGVPRLASFATTPPTIARWSETTRGDTYDWARQFFGDDSTWKRFSLLPPAKGKGELWSTMPIIADVITGSSLDRLNAYGIEACYKFHGYGLTEQTTVDLGGGVKGTSMRWQDGDGPRWTTVYWHWPVMEHGKRRYERVTLLLADTGKTDVADTNINFDTLDGRVDNALSRGELKQSKLTPHDQALRGYLVAVARKLVARQGTTPSPS
jgi:exosortase/archaeosortase family protein